MCSQLRPRLRLRRPPSPSSPPPLSTSPNQYFLHRSSAFPARKLSSSNKNGSSNSYHHCSSAPSSSLSTTRGDVSIDRQVSRSTSLITKLGREGRIDEARRVFDRMPVRDVICWTAIITAYIRCRMMRDARFLFDLPSAVKNVVTWTAMLSGYLRSKRIEEAEELFWAMPEKNVVSWNTMVGGYADCGMVDKALHLFEEMPFRNVVSWNTVLSALAKSEKIDKALELFERMPERDVVSWTTMVSGLSQNGRIDEARVLFDKMPQRNVVSWNAMISGYAQNQRLTEALDFFENMPGRDIASWNTMITGFIQNGDLSRARALFDRMKEKNVITWTTLITGYAQGDQGEEALRMFTLMQNDGVEANQGTFVSVLAAVSDLAGLVEGKQIHQIICKSIFESSPFVQSALLSMYAKCGQISMARKIFDMSEHKDLVTWNSMVAAYAHHGYGQEAICLLEEMQKNGINPDGTTYIGLLSGCSHSGLVDEGFKLFAELLREGSIEVREDHYACLVDLCGRAGRLQDAVRFIDQHMASHPSARIWGALLAGCNVHGNVEIGNLAAKRLLKIEPGNAGTYMLLSNIYASTGKWKDASKVRLRMKNRGLKKQPGCSWIEVENVVHVFAARDKSHVQREMIYHLLQDLHYEMKMMRYLPNEDPNFDGYTMAF